MTGSSARVRYAIIATILFAVASVIYVALWVATRTIASGMLALMFAAVTIAWACVCVKWRRQR